MALFESASLVVTPNGVKASKLYSVKPADGSGDMTVTRATTATRVNASGIIESVATNVPRLDYTNSTCPSILIEPQRTNLALYSEQFNNAVWEKGATITLSNNTSETTSPFGINNATKAIANGTGFIFIRQLIALSTTNSTTSSIYVKKANNRYVGLRTASGGILHDVFDFDTETWTNNSGSTLSFDKLANGWYRLKSSRTNALVNAYISIIIPSNTSGAESATVSNLSVYIFGGQAELNVLNSTSYIPTITASVTRNADLITKTGISSLIGQTEGTIFLDTKYSSSASTSLRSFKVFGLSDEIGLALNSGNLVRTFVNGASDTITTAPKTDSRIKIAFSYNNSGVVLFVNGVQYALPNGGSQIITSLDSISFSGLGSQLQQANINSEILFKTRLTNAELATLTTL